ncbi:mechanosensitive ion channel family protein [Phenylobacterium sp.]|uniref:mechanosensitive ion channel family protein n=1 Tax=Phenylobacterium sp. TaxID=1871053 RepID=UPI0027300630|nr:mechanosensitive ion channel family protein [Phenylobacterium sp.]MDP2213203.1 mechanosensitive ion channel family protein [Phenylobacterium sp.]
MADPIYAFRPEWAPLWLFNLAALGLGAVAGLILHELVTRAIRRSLRGKDTYWSTLLVKLRRPSRLAALILGLAVGASFAQLGEGGVAALRRILAVAFVILVGWSALTALDIWSLLHVRRFKLDAEDNLLARKHVTQTRILTRTAGILIVILTAGFALMTFPGVRQYGISLLASAGAAGIIAGLALQPFLTNLIAGVQIATTQPIRIDDAVIVENEWGQIEEITSTYVVVRLWDWRRMVLPLTYFIQQPFQNWTRETASLIGTVMLYVDYTAPVDVLRAKLEEITRASPLWDGQVVNLAVTETSERTMQVRCLVSARNAPTTFDLRCEVREKMVAFLQSEMPQVLPKDRLDAEARLKGSPPGLGNPVSG